MRIFSALNSGYVRQQNIVESAIRKEPEKLCECIALAKIAAEYSQWKDERSTQLWLLITEACWKKGFNFSSIAEFKSDSGVSLLETLIESKDWDSCLIAARALQPGFYCGGKIQRTDTAIWLNKNEDGKQLGLLESVENCYYAGDLLHGKPHGSGITKLSEEDVFECTYENNQKHGLGVYRNRKDNRIKNEGLYINNQFVGNTKLPMPRQKNGFLSFFRG
jgi:hypothetical protein